MNDTQPAGAGETVSAPADAAAPVATPEAATSEAQPSQPEKTVDPKDAELDKLRKALDRKNRDIGKKTAMYHQLRQELDGYKKAPSERPQQAAQDGGKPNPEAFAKQGKTYEDYLEALADWKTDQKLGERQKKAEADQKAVSDQQWMNERSKALSDSVAKAREKYSDYQNILDEHSEVLSDLPQHIQEAIFHEAEEAPDAFYQLVKEDRLDDLLDAPNAVKAAAVLAKAAVRAEQRQKPVTKAPAPLSPAKGTAAGSKPIDQMSGKEILDWVRS